MKELLYIPNGIYYRFNGNNTPFGEYIDDLYYVSSGTKDEFEEEVIQRVCTFFYDVRNYISIGIISFDSKNPLTRSEFEIVEVSWKNYYIFQVADM